MEWFRRQYIMAILRVSLCDQFSSHAPHKGTALDIEQTDELVTYLRRRDLIGGDERPRARVLQGGVSNRTVLVERASGEAWVIKQALAKLRVQVDWFSSPERIHREALGLRWLAVLAPPESTPGFVYEDNDEHVLIMQAVPEPHANWKTLLLAGQIEDDHVDQFGRLLAALHRHAWERRAEVEPVFADTRFFESLRLEPYYSFAAEQVPAAAPFLHDLVADTRARHLTLVHGDYSPKNVLIYDGRLILLDHEVIHFGDPAFDLGFSMTHLLSKAHHLPDHRHSFAAAANRYWRTYIGAVGATPWDKDLEAHVVRQTLGCLLARVAGRSPLEYLSAFERGNQQAAVLALLQALPTSVPSLVARFLAEVANLERRCH